MAGRAGRRGVVALAAAIVVAVGCTQLAATEGVGPAALQLATATPYPFAVVGNIAREEFAQPGQGSPEATGVSPLDPGAAPRPDPTSSPEATASPAAMPTGTPEPTPTPVASPGPTPVPTPTPEPLELRAVNVQDGKLAVLVSWPGAAGPGTVSRRMAPATTTFEASGSEYVDLVGNALGATIHYAVTAGLRRFAGSLEPGTAPHCNGSNADGPPDCEWTQTEPGVTPFGVCFASASVPAVAPDATFAWTDRRGRAGYIVIAGDGEAKCEFAPPFTFAPRVAAFTAGRSLGYGQNPGISGITDDPRVMRLLALVGYAPVGWPSPDTGRKVGWKVRALSWTDDGRVLLISGERMLPRVLAIQ